MPQKRSTNAARGKKGATRTAAATKAVAASSVSLQNDMVGAILAVLSIALLVSLVSSSSAPVTSAVERGLTLCFGMGALLCPLTLFLFSATFFVEGEEPFGTRAALGLAIVSVSVLSMLSLFVPMADVEPAIVLDPVVLQDAGGYIGGIVAWTLLSFVGRPVGLVLLIGLTALGAIICGFSVSGFISRVRVSAAHVRAVRDSAREERTAMRSMALQAEPALERATAATLPNSAMAAPKTTFIGDRKTSVLTRRARRRPSAQDYDDYDDDDFIDDRNDDAQAGSGSKDASRTERDAKHGKATRAAGTQDSRAGKKTGAKRTASKGATLQGQQSPERTKKRRAQGALAPKTRRRTTRKSQPAQMSDELTIPEFLRAQTSTNPSEGQKTKATASVAARPGDGDEGYELPPLNLLSSNPNSAGTASSREELDETMARLQETLREFGLTSRVVDYVSGPIVTTFRIEMGEGERVNRIRNLEDDIALNLAAEKVRIFAPVPGTSLVGIEIPNKTRQNVHLGDVLPTAKGGPLEVAIGRDSSGHPVVADIAKMPHMLVAGTTGSGKSVMINSMIMSLLMRTTPKQVRLIMIDPKRVEFSCYNGLPHLYVPVVTEPRQAASALQWAVTEMERRLRLFERAGAREIKVYNRMCTSGQFDDQERPPEPMPYLVVIIDELSDLMMVAGKDVEASIVRIAQLARAAGIHLVIATQRPSANVVTGLIKSNIDNRVALKVSSGIDSRVILDETGAERLLGNGDMLFKYRGLNMQRVLGCYTSDNEINEVVSFIRDQAEPDYHEEILSAVVPGQAGGGMATAGVDDEDDPLVWEAAQIVVESRLGSTSGLQRRLKVGYARAGRIMDMLEAKGIVGPPDGSKPREVLLDEDGLEELRTAEAAYREVI